jgi:NAD(P)-dependent dehydrogenase (short-subunit alcohol dehydrogenase family)
MTKTAVIAGVGPGLGASVAERFATEGWAVALLARSEGYISALAERLTGETDGEALALPTDLADPVTIDHSFERIRETYGSIDALVNHASATSWTGLLDQDPDAFRRALAVGPEAALHCSQAAVPDMLDGDGGTVIFTGATTSVRGREGAVGFSAAKFACRGLAESMARELGPEGVHVAHVVIDGMIRPPDADPESVGDESIDPDAIADSYWTLVQQDRSAWTLELDLRPHVEEF